MRQLRRSSQEQHSRRIGHCLAISKAVKAHIAWLLLALILIHTSQTAADFADDIATASNYALADVASYNAKVIHNLLQFKWNATSVAVLQDALKAATAQKGIYGAAAAFSVPAIRQYNITQAALYSPYCHEPPAATEDAPLQDITCMDIGDLNAGGGYNYTDPKLSQTNWYTLFYKMTKPKAQMSGVYFDKGAGEIWMDTYSVPVMSDDGKTLLAVATADIRIPDAARTNTTATSAATSRAEPCSLLLLLLVAVACCSVLMVSSIVHSQ